MMKTTVEETTLETFLKSGGSVVGAVVYKNPEGCRLFVITKQGEQWQTIEVATPVDVDLPKAIVHAVTRAGKQTKS